jgi:hypothetical protein
MHVETCCSECTRVLAEDDDDKIAPEGNYSHVIISQASTIAVVDLDQVNGGGGGGILLYLLDIIIIIIIITN